MTNSEQFHAEFGAIVEGLMEQVRDDLLEGPGTCSRAAVLAQLLMNELAPHPLDPEDTNLDLIFEGKFTATTKATLVHMADHMGPDWAQALYHAAVFITKVA